MSHLLYSLRFSALKQRENASQLLTMTRNIVTILLPLTLAGCASNMVPDSTPLSADRPSSHTAVLYFIRAQPVKELHFVTLYNSDRFVMDSLANLPNNCYFVYRLPAGYHKIVVGGGSLVAINKHFEGGKKYYFLIRQGGSNGIGSRVQVLQISPGNPKALLSRLTRVKKSGLRLSPQASGVR